MKTRTILFCAAALCGFAAFAESQKEIQWGVTFGFYAPTGYMGSDKAKEEIDVIAAAGANWVTVVPIVWQDSYCSDLQYKDFAHSQSDLDLKDAIDYIHSKGMKVQLRPMLECKDGIGRLGVWMIRDRERMPGRVCDHRAKWFKSMAERSVYYARCIPAPSRAATLFIRAPSTSRSFWRTRSTGSTTSISCRSATTARRGRLKGILWHQGESDATPARAPKWGAKFESMVKSLRRREFGEVPIIAGELGAYLEDYRDKNGNGLVWREINSQLHGLEGKISRFRVVSADGLMPNRDKLHFNTESLRIFGLRYAAAFESLENTERGMK